MSKQSKPVEVIEAVEQVEAEEIMEQLDQVEQIDEVEAQLEQLEQQLEAVEQADEAEQIKQLSVEEVAQMIVERMEDSFTLYRAHVAVNQVLHLFQVKKDGKAYVIRPQMMYNYNKNHMIVRGKKVEMVTKDQLVAFIVKFVGKRVS